MTVPRHRVALTTRVLTTPATSETVPGTVTATSHRLGLDQSSGVVAASPTQPREGAQCVAKRYRPTPNRYAPSLPPPPLRCLRGRFHQARSATTTPVRVPRPATRPPPPPPPHRAPAPPPPPPPPTPPQPPPHG